MRRYLVVANQTLGGEQLTAKLAECMDAIRKLASREEADEIIVSTCRKRLSRWVAMDLPRRIRCTTSLPVAHITGPAGPSL